MVENGKIFNRIQEKSSRSTNEKINELKLPHSQGGVFYLYLYL
jgi:hypothetical protein